MRHDAGYIMQKQNSYLPNPLPKGEREKQKRRGVLSYCAWWRELSTIWHPATCNL